jgi:hypothetical protein
MVASISSLWLSRLVDDEIGEGTAVHAWDIRYGKSDVAYKITEGDFFPYSATSTDNSPSNEARNEYAAIPSVYMAIQHLASFSPGLSQL